jgi:DNA-binding HxlR family transcriptional regulator
MLGHLYETQDCSTARALEVVGERWSLLILRDAMFGGLSRFSQFQKSLGLATNVLAKRLDGFVAAGLMERRQQPGASGEQAEYVLTQKGLELKPALIALAEWGDKWVRPGPVVFQHRSDGRPVEIQLRRVGRVGRAGADAKVAIADVVARPR